MTSPSDVSENGTGGLPDRTRPVGVLTVDDQAVFRCAAREVVAATPGFQLVGEAVSGEEALVAVGDRHPDLVLLDVRMPGMGGVEAARRMAAAHPEVVIVLLSLDTSVEVAAEAEQSGARSLMSKQDFGPTSLRGLWAAHGPRA